MSLHDVAAWDNLAAAFWRAARGKRHRPQVQRYAAHLDANLALLRAQILATELPEGQLEVFEIHDPKRRTITAHAQATRFRQLELERRPAPEA